MRYPRMARLVQRAIENITDCGGNNHCAIMFDKRKIYSISQNTLGNKFGHHSVPSIHAEMGCLLREKISVKKNSILVIRLNKQGRLVNSKPCHFCTELMRLRGIYKVYYSNERGEIECHKLRDFRSAHVSKGFIMRNL